MSTISYNTKQKKLVLDFMRANISRQFTCDEITYLLSQQGTPVGKTTVYRQLERLARAGTIKRHLQHESKSFVYSYVEQELNCHEHLHLRCVKCGRYVHLGCDFMSGVSEHIRLHHNFIVDNSKTEITGTCAECASEREA